MTRTILASITLCTLCTISLAQTEYPEGAYRNKGEVAEKSPSEDYNLRAEMAGGKAKGFKLVSPDRKVKKSVIRDDIWAYSDGRYLYINGLKNDIQSAYCKVVEEGRYLAFMGAISSNAAYALTEATGGLVSRAVSSGTEVLYVFDTETLALNAVKKDEMVEMLKDYPELLAEYEEERKPNDERVKQGYVEELNELIAEQAE